jgi:hypothetical protein
MPPRALVVCLLLGCSRSTSIVTGVQPAATTTADVEPEPTPEPVEAKPIDESTSVATKSSPEPSTWPTIEAKPPSLTGKAAQSGRPRGDRSRALPGWDTGWVGLGPPKDAQDGEVRGKVTEIRPAVGEVAGVVRIEGEAGAVVELELRGSGKLALAVGDEVTAKWQTVHIQIHTIHDLAVVDAKGRVVYAGSGTGNPGFAPGWYFERKGVFDRGSPHMRGGARREDRWLVIANGAAVAFVHGGEGARRLSTPDGDYAVGGSAVTWSAGMRPPDSSEYETFSIVRLP